MAGPAHLRLLERSLVDLSAGANPSLPGKVRKVAKGQVGAPCFPTDIWDRLLFFGYRAVTWMEPGIGPEDVISGQAAAYAPGTTVDPSVCVVLGAGNVTSIAPTDALYKLFVELKTVMLKVNPVNEYIGPILERALAPLVEADVLRFAYGGGAVGEYLTSHDLADSIHMTGSDKTHDAIVFGSGPEGAERKRRGEVLTTAR